MVCCREKDKLLGLFYMYFQTLAKVGYKKQSSALALFVIAFIDDFHKDMEGVLNDFEEWIICEAMRCLTKDKCLENIKITDEEHFHKPKFKHKHLDYLKYIFGRRFVKRIPLDMVKDLMYSSESFEDFKGRIEHL